MSEEQKHTPGPWEPCTANNGRCACRMVWSRSGDVPVFTATALTDKDESYTLGVGVSDEDEIAANLALVAASPDLLRELEEAEWVTDLDEDIQRWCPRCGNGENSGHAPDCTLADTLRKARGDQATNPDTPSTEGS